jgi:hypothetical protein
LQTDGGGSDAAANATRYNLQQRRRNPWRPRSSHTKSEQTAHTSHFFGLLGREFDFSKKLFSIILGAQVFLAYRRNNW